MMADLFEGGIDEFEGAAGGCVGGVLVGVDPDGEELGVEVALLCGVVVEHAAVEGVGEAPVLVDEALWGVGVSIDDDGGVVDGCGIGHRELYSFMREENGEYQSDRRRSDNFAACDLEASCWQRGW